MKILFIADTVGRPGRKAVTELLPKIKEEHAIDLTFMNGENLAHGKGITEKTMHEMIDAGVDFFTSGNHIWAQPDIFEELDKDDRRVIRPANYPSENPGKGWQIIEDKNGNKVLVLNIMGRGFMKAALDCPFKAADALLEEHASDDLAAILLDFHAETTSEKIALRHYLDGRVSAMVGTHTHVMTADHEVTAKGTAYISDVGMVGKKDSVIGVDAEAIIKKFMTQMSVKHEITPGDAIFNAVILDIDTNTKKASAITPLQLTYKHV